MARHKHPSITRAVCFIDCDEWHILSDYMFTACNTKIVAYNRRYFSVDQSLERGVDFCPECWAWYVTQKLLGNVK